MDAGGHSVAGAVDDDHGGVGDTGWVERASSVSEVVTHDGQSAWTTRSGERSEQFGNQLGVGDVVGGPRPVGVPRDRDFVHLTPPQSRLLQAPRRRGRGAAGIAVMFDPGESLLLRERDGLPVRDEAGGGVMMVGTADSEHVPHRSALQARGGGRRGE